MGTPSLIFWRQYLRRPFGVGAIAPSSTSLAQAMVAALAPRPADTVVELGPGTGVFTRQLLQAGVSRERLILVEFDQDFVLHLRSAFKGVTIVHGDARRLPDILARLGQAPVPKILSGLPLRSMAAPVRREIAEAMVEALAPGGCLVQFTYFRNGPLPQEVAAGLSIERAGHVLRNIPPAFIWRYVKRAQRLSPAPAPFFV